jgi:hypothetical protein
MSHDMLHHAELKIFFEVLHKFEFIWIWNLVWIWIWKPYRKRNRKGIRKSREKRKRGSSPVGPLSPARLRAHAAWEADPACQRQFSLARALPLSLAAQWGRPVDASFLHPRAPSLSVSWARISSRWVVAPRAPFFSLCVVGLPCQFRPLRAHRGPARAHSRMSPDFSATTPAHAPSSLLRAPLVPRAHPSPHFAQLHPLRASPWGETLVPVPNFPYCALCSANFTFAGARPRRSVVLARCPADLARSSSAE